MTPLGVVEPGGERVMIERDERLHAALLQLGEDGVISLDGRGVRDWLHGIVAVGRVGRRREDAAPLQAQSEGTVVQLVVCASNVVGVELPEPGAHDGWVLAA